MHKYRRRYKLSIFKISKTLSDQIRSNPVMVFSFRCFDKSSEPLAPSQACRRFKVSEIQKATHNFDESLMIGEGGYFQVYKGKISNGPVAIKRLSQKSKVGQPEDLLEVENQMLFTLRHRNLVSLFGFCRQAMKPVF